MILEFDLFYKNLLNAIRKHVQVNKYQWNQSPVYA